jgi:hypothetical protein
MGLASEAAWLIQLQRRGKIRKSDDEDFIYIWEFYDLPHLIFCNVNGAELLLHSHFDDNLDDYVPYYRVYELPAPRPPSPVWSWEAFPLSEAKLIGTIPVATLEFDETKRNELNAAPLLELIALA